MIILVGPSASGKTSIAKELIEKYGFTKLVTYTTRKPRPGEVDGVDYYFISYDNFISKEAKGEFIETISYNGNNYGTAFKDIDDKKVLIVDILGANKFNKELGSQAMIFYITANDKEIKERMIARGDSQEEIIKRMNGDKVYFDIKLMNHVDEVIDTNKRDVSIVTKEIHSKYLERLGNK